MRGGYHDRLGARRNRQSDDRSEAPARRVFKGQHPVHRFCERASDRQAQSETGTVVRGVVRTALKGLEEGFSAIDRYARASINYP